MTKIIFGRRNYSIDRGDRNELMNIRLFSKQFEKILILNMRQGWHMNDLHLFFKGYHFGYN